MKQKTAVITKAFTRWGRAYAVGEVVEDRIDKIGVLVHEKKARLVKPDSVVPPAPVAKPDPQPEAPKPEPAPVPASPSPSPVAEPSPEPVEAAEPVTVADVAVDVQPAPSSVGSFLGTQRRKGHKSKAE